MTADETAIGFGGRRPPLQEPGRIMTEVDRQTVKDRLMSMLLELREDWEYSAELTEKTGLFKDLGFESIDAVALGSAIEEDYGQKLPLAELLTRAGEQGLE